MIRCCIKAYAHFSAANVGVSRSIFLESVGGGAVNIELLTSITKSTASFELLYAWKSFSIRSGERGTSTTYSLVKLLLLFIFLFGRLPFVLVCHDEPLDLLYLPRVEDYARVTTLDYEPAAAIHEMHQA